jgi:uncharacterized repeat protein (TIGR03803 family)
MFLSKLAKTFFTLVLASEAILTIQAQTFNLLYSFSGSSGDGAQPYAGLTPDGKGNFFGTTDTGGATGGACGGGCGTIFELDKTGKTTVLYAFTGNPDGANPYGGLVRDKGGNLFGTTAFGGVANSGTVFQLSNSGGVWKEKVLYSFTGKLDGGAPEAGLLLVGSALYGTTATGGKNFEGTVFKLTPVGSVWKEKVLHSFGAAGDGTVPLSRLVADPAGNVYGTTFGGGKTTGACANGIGCGTMFQLTPAGKETVLHKFSGAPDGQWPKAGLIRDATGNFYGTTSTGGNTKLGCGTGCGTVFELTNVGKEKVLYKFLGDGNGQGDGALPLAGVVLVGGKLYGTTSSGGASSGGTVFRLNKGTPWTESLLHSYTGTDGGEPRGDLVPVVKGGVLTLFGTTQTGGLHLDGTLFSLAP